MSKSNHTTLTCPECGRQVRVSENKFGDAVFVHHDYGDNEDYSVELGRMVCDGDINRVGVRCRNSGSVVGYPTGGKTKY